MRACPVCGTANQDVARFCSQCATPLGEPQADTCPSCGREVAADDRFCPHCGAPLAKQGAEERKLVTILFADITSSTALGEKLDPETLREVIQTFFTAMQEVIDAEGGTVEKFIGDAVMAAFGVPVSHEDDAARALRAALRMQRRLTDLNQDLEPRHGITLGMRIGVNTGEVMASTTPGQRVGMVSGDAVNVAARLEQSAEPGHIVVSERTARATRAFRFGARTQVEIRGRNEPIVAVELLGETEADGAPQQPRGIPGLRAPMVGRDRELDLLQSMYRRVTSERRPQLVTVYGDPGIGKSRLVREFTEWVSTVAEPPTVVVGRCLPYGEGVTYWPLAEILKARAGVLDNDTADAALNKIRAVTRDVLVGSTDLDRSAAAMSFGFGLEDPRFGFAGMSPRQVRIETHEAWRSFFAGLATPTPVVIVVEDIHWADGALLDLLEELAERTPGPLLFICPARPELTQRRATWGGGRRNFSSLSLEPLSPDDAEQLVGFLLAVEDLPETIREQILQRAEGNPFFLEEIVRHLIDEGHIVHSGDRWRAASEIHAAVIPDTVQGVLAARIDLLEPPEKRALQSAAVVGRVFWMGPVARLLDGESEALEESLWSLENRELITSRLGSAVAGDREYIFKHVLTRDVAYGSLPRRERGVAHARVAAWIEEAAGERRREFADMLATHYSEAHERAQLDRTDDVEMLRAKTFEYLLLAAAEARSKMLLERSNELASRALTLAQDADEQAACHESLGMTALYDYQGDDAWRWLTMAVDERVKSGSCNGDALGMLCARAIEAPLRWPASMTARPEQDEVRRYLEIGIDHASPQSEAKIRLLLSKAFWVFAFRTFTKEAEEEARSAGEEAFASATEVGRPDLASAALDGVGSIYFMQGLHGRSRKVHERRLEIVKTLMDPWELGDAYQIAADTAVMVGDYRAAVELGTVGFERSRTGPVVWGACKAFACIGRARVGEWDVALEEIRELEEAFREALLGGRFYRYFVLAAMASGALIHELRGNQPQADVFMKHSQVEDANPQSSRSVANVARIFAMRGWHERARAVLETSWLQLARGSVLEGECDVVAIAGDWDRAPGVVATARAWAEEAELIALPFYADRLEGRAAFAGGDASRGVELLQRAASGFDSLSARWDTAWTELFLGEALIATGDRERARSVLDHARVVFDELGSVREQARALELLDEV